MWNAPLLHTFKRLGLYETLATPVASESWDLGMKDHSPQAVVEGNGLRH
jgi:hypothetical protein